MRNVGSELSLLSSLRSGASGSDDVSTNSDCSNACLTADGVLSRTISSEFGSSGLLPERSACASIFSVGKAPSLSFSQIGSSIQTVSKFGSV